MSDDDVWGDDDVSPHADIQRDHVKRGYVDGLSNAQESGLQLGFDKGYPSGAELGVRVGRILARLQGTEHFDKARQDLHISLVLAKTHFDENLDLKNDELLARWEHIIDTLPA